MKKGIRAVVICFFAIAEVYLFCAAVFCKKIRVRVYDVVTEKACSKTRLLLITDLHSSLYGNKQSELIKKIDKIKPDAILFGGDIYDKHRSGRNSDMLLENVGKRYKCYYVTGNHEYRSGKDIMIKKKLRNRGITVLEGSGSEIGEGIMLWGVDDIRCGKYRKNQDWHEEFENCSSSVEREKFNILLSHRPDNAEEYKNSSFDLILSGHAHGGQWRIPFILNGLYASSQGLFPKYAGGEYDLGNNKMIVSRGLAMSFIPRIFNPPELVLVNLRQEEAKWL